MRILSAFKRCVKGTKMLQFLNYISITTSVLHSIDFLVVIQENLEAILHTHTGRLRTSKGYILCP